MRVSAPVADGEKSKALPTQCQETLRQRRTTEPKTAWQEYRNAPALFLVHCRVPGRIVSRANCTYIPALAPRMPFLAPARQITLTLACSWPYGELYAHASTAVIGCTNVPVGTLARMCRPYPVSPVPSVVKVFSGRSKGNRITSRIVCESVSSMHSRSTPTPTPPAGGIP
jgi:hypothetical protein